MQTNSQAPRMSILSLSKFLGIWAGGIDNLNKSTSLPQRNVMDFDTGNYEETFLFHLCHLSSWEMDVWKYCQTPVKTGKYTSDYHSLPQAVAMITCP